VKRSTKGMERLTEDVKWSTERMKTLTDGMKLSSVDVAWSTEDTNIN
jgi:hypothetical protein